MRRTLVNLAVLAGALALAFAVCEIVVRMLYADESTLYPRYHTDYRYGDFTIRGIRPNSVFRHTSPDGSWTFVTNGKGLRNDHDFAYDKPSGMVRVLTLGDSHTQGYEVRQQATFSAVLERGLARGGRRAEVLNTGVSGFSTAEELILLENEGYRYHPDVVVVGFFANDFEDNVKAGIFDLDSAGGLVVRKHEHLPGVSIQNVIYAVPGVQWLSENSYFYSLLFNDVWNFFKLRLGARAAREAAAKSSTAPRPDDGVEYALPTSASASPYQVSLAAQLILRMQRFCREHGIRLIVVDVPDFDKPFHYRPSITPALYDMLAPAGVEVVASRALLHDFDGVAEMHVPHGHHHISEFTHALIGNELARRIGKPPPSP